MFCACLWWSYLIWIDHNNIDPLCFSHPICYINSYCCDALFVGEIFPWVSTQYSKIFRQQHYDCGDCSACHPVNIKCPVLVSSQHHLHHHHVCLQLSSCVGNLDNCWCFAPELSHQPCCVSWHFYQETCPITIFSAKQMTFTNTPEWNKNLLAENIANSQHCASWSWHIFPAWTNCRNQTGWESQGWNSEINPSD